MRVDVHDNVQERRDAIDQRWYAFLKSCNIFPILLPNFKESIKLLEEINLDGIILTGGNSLESSGGDAPERDSFENALIQYAIKSKRPILGICRGMQLIQTYFDVTLHKILGHVATRHKMNFLDQLIEVNSYHEYGAFETVPELNILAQSSDKVVEAVEHETLPILGMMWHPEREEDAALFDIAIFKKHFNS